MGSIKSRTRNLAGRFANRFVPDNPTSDTAIQSTIKTTKTTKTAVRVKKTYMKILNTEKVIKSTLLRAKAAPIINIIIIVAVLFFIFMNIQKGMTMIISFSGVFAEEKTVNSYKIEIEKLESEFVEGLKNYQKQGFDKYRIEYTNGFSEFKINRKEILCYMLVMFQ